MKNFFNFLVIKNAKYINKTFFLHLYTLLYLLFYSAKLCEGYVINNALVRGRQRQRCIPCARRNKSLIKKLKKSTPLQNCSKNGQKALRAKCRNMLRKNMRLRKKV